MPSPATQVGAGRGADADILVQDLRSIERTKYVLTGEGLTKRYRTSFRFGVGKVSA